MADSKKDEIWFKHDATTRQDEKISALISLHGMAGYGRFWTLVEGLRLQPGYRYNIGSKLVLIHLAKEMQLAKPEEAEAFIRSCIDDCELLKMEGVFVYSPSLCRRMDAMEERREKYAENGRKGGTKTQETRRQKGSNARANSSNAKATLKQDSSNAKANSSRGEERREEKSREELDANASTRTPKIFKAPTLDEVVAYFREKGYQESEATKAWNYYDSAGWKDSQGKPVKNWKQKMQGVWFKDENKIPGTVSPGSRKVIMRDPAMMYEYTWTEEQYEQRKHRTELQFIRYEN